MDNAGVGVKTLTPFYNSSFIFRIISSYMTIPVGGTPEFSNLYLSSDKKSQLYKKLDDILELLKENPTLGDLIEFKRIPKPIKKRYPDLDNLFRIEVNRDWRLLYTLVGWPKEKKVYVLCAMSHKEYDELFKR